MMSVFGVGLLCLIPLSINNLHPAAFTSLSGVAWGGLVFVSIVATFCVHLLNAYALKLLPANVVGSYLYLHPVAASALAYGIGLETIGPTQLWAALSVLLGLFISNASRPASSHSLNKNSITIKI